MVFRVFLGFSGVVVSYLFTVVILPFLKAKDQPIEIQERESPPPPVRKDVSFIVDGTMVSGWLYLPKKTSTPVPCVVLTNGFCGTKDMILEQYALRFVDAGIAALSFDYRHFGKSDGEPRQLYSVTKQLEDATAAIEYARSRTEINADSIFVWGTSSSGNYGIGLAAIDQKIAGIIGQTPSLDHQADGKAIFKREGILWMIKILIHAQRDKGRSRLGLPPHMFPAVGKPGTTAMLNAPGTLEGYAKLAKNSTTFRNETCARLMFEPHGPDIEQCAEKITCPVQLFICENDTIMAPNSHHKAANILGDLLDLHTLSIGHFDIYEGDAFEQAMKAQINFIKHIVSDKRNS